MTYLIKIENGEPVGNPHIKDNLFYLFPNFNWNRVLTTDLVAELGYAVYEFTQPPEVPKYKKLVEGKPVQNSNNGTYYQTWQVVDMNEEERQQLDIQKGREIRYQRNALLMDSDWAILPDSPLYEGKIQEYKMYRQQLRNLPLQPGFPWDVVWPTKP